MSRPLKPAPDAFVRICPLRDILARMGEKWASLALVALNNGPMRFGALHRKLEGISQKMLSQTLRNLERDGLMTCPWRITKLGQNHDAPTLLRPGA